VGRTEEALEHGKQALEIHRRLAQTRPDRYDSYYAGSLHNYASRLSDVGRTEEALEHGKQALEIHRRLAQTRPDRYDPVYAASLGNYAIHLREVGKNGEALEHAKLALALYERLSAKRPDRFDEFVLNSAASVHFLAWLCDQPATGCTLPNPNAMPNTIRLHRRSVVKFYATFVGACLGPDQASRTEAFRQAPSEWSILPFADRLDTREYWFCVAAWCATYAPDSMAQFDWLTEWRCFVTQREGRVPQWMLKVGRRLSFEWPK
jgi:hypothetical protein